MCIIQSGDKFSLADVSGTYNQLPKGNYLVKFNPRDGYFLQRKEDFILPKKIYGDHSIVNRWLKSWEVNSHKNLGILLSGIKGTGKTITAQKFCIESELPVIIINDCFYENDFIDFITQPEFNNCIVFIDEFEKIYGSDEYQYPLLSIMDGNYSTKLIFLLTVNEDRLNTYLVNRLNRIKYQKSYNELEDSVVKEVIDDLLVNKAHADSIHKFFDKINLITFDLLVNLIKEMNLFNEDALTCGKHLNLQVEKKLYKIIELFNGKEYEHGTRYIDLSENIITLNRDNLKYLPKFKGKSNEEENIHYSKYGWEVEFDLNKCIVEKTKTQITITDPNTELKFIFRDIYSSFLF